MAPSSRACDTVPALTDHEREVVEMLRAEDDGFHDPVRYDGQCIDMATYVVLSEREGYARLAAAVARSVVAPD